MKERIIKFLSTQRLMTLATADQEGPHCCHVFYVFDPDSFNLYFMSSPETKHIRQAIANSKVAGTVASSDTIIARLKGIQFSGTFFVPKEHMIAEAEKLYLKKFPLATFIKTTVWCIRIDFIKMTDNTLGFAKKIIWTREASYSIN